MTTLITPTTSAVTYGSVTFEVDYKGATLSADALAGSEEVDIQYSGNGGATWTALYDEGSAVVLTATKPQIKLVAQGKYQIAKDATASACGIYVARG